MMNKLAKLSAVSTVCAVISSAPAMAQTSSIPGSFSANVALTSEYLFRGISQTDDTPAIQGGFDYEIEVAKPASVYLGVWGSNVDFNEGSTDNASIEIDYYGGIKGGYGDSGFSWDTGFIYYTYPGVSSGLNYDFWEFQAAIGYDFGVAAVTASINYSPENFGKSGESFYPKFAVDVPVPGVKGLGLSGYVAKQYIEDVSAFGTNDYVEWNFGVSYNVFDLFDAAINYSDTDVSPDTDGKDEAVIFTVSRSF